ncbi:MAG: acyl-CoA dehydrogenase family protein [Chloroflexi bacterium]|nr:acyl-CoA dehydrogenase family protein [Chloroflexota bacterium]
MDVRLTPEVIALRNDIAAFAAKELPQDWQGGFEYGDEYCGKMWPFTREIAGKLGQHGWLGMAWSPRYGGTDRPVMSQLIYYEEAIYHRIPSFDMGIGGACNVGPVIAAFGTEAQKMRYLPGLARGKEFWCVGYSEPNSGSDLNSLSTWARKTGTGYVVRGEKIWTSAAQIADWCWLLTRTEESTKPGRGLTIFIVPMRSEGITVRPINNMAGHSSFNQVFFDDVQVGEENIVGRINGAWDCMPLLLTMERTFAGAGSISRSRRLLDEMIAYLHTGPTSSHQPPTSRLSSPAFAFPLLASRLSPLASRLADLAIGVEAGRLLAYRAACAIQQGKMAYNEASMVRLYSSQLEQKTAAVVMQCLGLHGQLMFGSPEARLGGHAAKLYLASISESILGGTTEVQKSIIANRGLGLGRP